MAYGKQFNCMIEIFVQVEQYTKMILSDPDRFWTFLKSERLCFFEVNEGVFVVPGFVLAQTQQRPRRAEVWPQFDHMLQWLDRLGIPRAAEINKA